MIQRRSVLKALAAGALLPALPARAQRAIELKPELGQPFHEANTQGTFAALELKNDGLVMTDETRTRSGELPASTYKVPHALIALETGVVADVDKEIIRWDGVTREIPEWNRDHTLRSAMKYSVVPVFQQIARRIGYERMKKYVDEFNYGNRDIGGAPIDRFWLEGNLRITPLEQIAFIKKLYQDDLPVSIRSLDLVKDILPVETTDRATIHAKTGAVGRDGKLVIGWLVGYAVKGGDATIFAMNMDLHSNKDLALRMPAAKYALEKIGAI